MGVTGNQHIRGVSSEEITILYVDDHTEYAELAATFLEREDERVEVITESTASDGLDHFTETGGIDCIVSDYDMPGQNGIEFLKAVREVDPDIPFLLFTGKGSEEVASDAIAAGATDYLQKQGGTEQYELLANRVRNAVEQYRSEHERRQNERRFEAVFEDPQMLVGLLETDGTLIHANQTALDIIDTDLETVTGEPFWETPWWTHCEKLQADVQQWIERAAAGEYVEYETEHLNSGGDSYDVNGTVRPVTNDHGEVESLIVSARDITERKERERELGRYETIIETLPVGVVRTNLEGEITDVNPTFESLLEGDPKEDIKAYNVNEFYADSETRQRLVNRLQKGETVQDEEVKLTTLANEEIWIEVTITLTETDDEQFFTGIAQDITERKEREWQLTRLHEATRDLIEADTSERMATIATESADDILELPINGVHLYDEDSAGLVPVAVSDSNRQLLGEPPILDAGIAWEVFQRGEPRILDDVYEADEVYNPETEIRSEMHLPLGNHGVFIISSPEIDAFSETDIMLSKLLAANLETALDRTERERQAKERAAAMEASIDGLAILNEDGKYEFVNQAHASIYGYDTPDEFIGENWQICYADKELERMKTDVLSALSEDGDWRGKAVGTRKDGTTFPQELSLTLLDDGRIICIVRDITEQTRRKESVETLHEATRELMTTSDEQAIADLMLKAAKDVLDFSLVSVRYLDGPNEELVPVAVTDAGREVLGEPEVFDDDESLAWQPLETGEPRLITDVLEHEDSVNSGTGVRSLMILPIGDYGTLNIASTLPDAFDESDVSLAQILTANVETALDRTAREQELRRQNEQLDEFASVVSHDLRNPLNVATGHLELASEECSSDHLDTVGHALDRMGELVDNLLTVAQEGDSENDVSTVELAKFTKNCWKTVDTAGATLVVETDAVIQANQRRVQQLLENLLRNAVKHGGENVTVTIGDLVDERGFYVEDDGSGIKADERDQVFERGYSTAKTGTGFGLWIVKQIANAHDWDISVNEGDNGGARFKITGVEVVAE